MVWHQGFLIKLFALSQAAEIPALRFRLWEERSAGIISFFRAHFLACQAGRNVQYRQRQAVTIFDILGQRLAFGDKFPADDRGSCCRDLNEWRMWCRDAYAQRGASATSAMDCVVPYGLVLRTIHSEPGETGLTRLSDGLG